jgi:hypothetical protein
MLPDNGALHRNTWELFNVNFKANFKNLRLSNCASVGEKKNFDKYCQVLIEQKQKSAMD